MDPFTEKILERARERQKKIRELSECDKGKALSDTNLETAASPNTLISSKSHPYLTDKTKVNRKEVVSDSNISSKVEFHSPCTESSSVSKINENDLEGNTKKFIRQNSKTRVSSEMVGSPKAHLKTLNIQKDNFNMEIKVSSSDNVRVEVEIEEEQTDDEGNNDSNGVKVKSCSAPTCDGLREDAKNRLKRLGKLYAGGDDANISSPIHRSEGKFLLEDESTDEVSSDIKPKKMGLGRLAALAQNINQWEDEVVTPKPTSNKTSTKKSWKQPAPNPPNSKNTNSPMTKTGPIKSTKKNPAPKPPVHKEENLLNIVNENESNGESGEKSSNEDVSETPSKQLKWDKNVLDTLESQGFQRTNSNSRLVYNYKIHKDTEKDKLSYVTEENETDHLSEQNTSTASKPTDKEAKALPKSPIKSYLRGLEVANKAAMFESSPSKTAKDPALLSVSERKALFEKNKGVALVPKAAFGMAAPINNTKSKLDDKNISTKNKCFGKNLSVCDSPSKTAMKCGGIASKMAALLENNRTISQEQIEAKVREERQKDLNLLLNRFNKNKEVHKVEYSSSSEEEEEVTEKTAMIVETKAKIVSCQPSAPPPPPIPSTSNEGPRRSNGKRTKQIVSPKVAAVLEDVKRIKVASPKEGRLYPCLSDIEATTETETEQANTYTPDSSFEDDANTSFGREILQAVCKNQTPHKRSILDDSTASDISDVLDDMDDYLDEAMAYDSNSSSGPTPPKLGKKTSPISAAHTSHSFSYKSYSSPQHKSSSKSPSNNIASPPRKSNDLPTYIVDGENVLPLTHTVSFYRKQQNQINKTPIKQISRQPLVEIEEERSPDNSIVENKIKELLEEVNKQQMIIAQTSQALNLCNSTLEFMGSTEQVEAEKVLLVATHRRLAALNEVQRLKVEETIRPQNHHSQNVPLEKGTVLISNITLPLKKEYVRALAAAGGKGHHVVCLIKSDEQVVPTKLVSTVASNSKNLNTELVIPGTVKLNNIYSDFTVTFEVYCLQAQEEILPHEVKYHINNKKASNRLTPRKAKAESRLIGPPKESPAGPQVVRTPTFALMGYAVLSIQAINRKQWTLNNAPPMSPLEGIVEMKISCELAVSTEKRGFLTMFEDVSGFGAWHRRWCHLKGDTLRYWKYPDDEKKMPPINTIDLKNCITKEVGPVSREICARLHTVLIECEREIQSNDKDSLTTVCKRNKTVIRHLLSADTKEERIEWSNKFNQALTAIRMWGKAS